MIFRFHIFFMRKNMSSFDSRELPFSSFYSEWAAEMSENIRLFYMLDQKQHQSTCTVIDPVKIISLIEKLINSRHLSFTIIFFAIFFLKPDITKMFGISSVFVQQA